MVEHLERTRICPAQLTAEGRREDRFSPCALLTSPYPAQTPAFLSVLGPEVMEPKELGSIPWPQGQVGEGGPWWLRVGLGRHLPVQDGQGFCSLMEVGQGQKER